MMAGGDRAMLEELAAAAPGLVTRAIDWCAVASGSRNPRGLADMAAILEAEMKRFAGTVQRLALAPPAEIARDGTEKRPAGGDALLLTMRPEAPLQVVLTGHYDTVYPADSEFRAVRTRGDGALHGPGIADMKGGISVMLGALAAFENHPDAARLGYRVLLSPDEETGSPGSAPLLAALAQGAQIGMTYEPALEDGRLAGTRAGTGNFHIVLRGKAAHAGRDFSRGRNAVVAAARLGAKLADLNGARAGVTVNLARIDGGGALNMVPDTAVVRLNVRFADDEAGAWIAREIGALVDGAAGDGIHTQLHGGLHRPAKPFTAAQVLLFETLRETGALLGQTIAWQDSGGCCEGNNLFAAGLANIDTLGVRGGAIHSENEFAWPESFLERARLSALFLARIAGGAIDAPAIKAAMA